MRIIIEIAPDTDDHGHTADSIADAQEIVASLQRDAERRQWQGMPGTRWERGDATVWVARARLDFD